MQLTASKNEKERKLTPQGKRLAELIKDMDLTESKFSKALGYEHPSIIYAAEKIRPISRELMGKIKEFVRKKMGKEINPEWLLTGSLPKLLTIKPDENKEVREEDGNKIYQISCPKCIEKDKKIECLRDELESLRKEYIECLKEISGLKKGFSK
jgi:hypothetical protein